MIKLWVPALALLLLAVGCIDPDDAPAESEVESAVTPSTGQGTSYQGTSYQGTSYQGTSYQGTSYQGTSYQGATYGSSALSNGSVRGTALVVWTRKPTRWEQRYPNKICYWNLARTSMSSCTNVDLASAPSPIAGTKWPASFRMEDGTIFAGTVQIGTSTTQVGAVLADSSTTAMHPLSGASTCTLVPYGASCDNPNGCRSNCDIWLYSVRLLDENAQAFNFCPAGERATVVAGTYDATGQRITSSTQFTFACTNGTVAKCTRWGYRPFGSARKFCNAPGCGTDTTLHPLVDYHQACVRAAAADYCSNGHSFTRNGTLVDIWDYNPTKVEFGMIPKTRGGTVFDATAFVWESGFDKIGAHQIDHLRYEELSGTPSYGSITDPGVGCPARFITGGSDDVQSTYMRVVPDGPWLNPTVWVDSTPACAHSELAAGKWLHRGCSTCTSRVPAYCTDPADSRGWDANCVMQAKSLCTSAQRMATHSECATGAGLQKYDSGCTLQVCLDPAFASCCNTGSTAWTSACVNAASSKCASASNGPSHFGFCTTILPPTF